MRKSSILARNKTIAKNEKKRNPSTSHALRNLQRPFQVLVEDSHDVFEIINSDGIIQYISPAVEKILGYKPEERIGKPTYEHLEPTDKAKFVQMLTEALSHPDQAVQEEIRIRTKTGQEIILACSMRNKLAEPSIQGLILNWRVSSSYPNGGDSQAKDPATLDELTRLPAQGAFESLLSRHMAEAGQEKALALIILDIDRFKYVNSYLGYEQGNQLLSRISRRLCLLCKDQVLLCRFSGGQYAIVAARGERQEDYLPLAEEILHLFDAPFVVDEHKLDVSVSLGISIYPHDAQDNETLVKSAYAALLRGKAAGKKRYQFYSADVEYKNYREFLLRRDMQKALEEGQFAVHYQPIVNLYTNEVLAVEALLRWKHPLCGMISPAEFIPIMEETGFIVDVGKWLLEEVCRSHTQWKEQGLPLKVSINCSTVQFAEEGFVESIRATLHKMGFDPRDLIIEITESVLIDNARKVISDLQKLQEVGIMVAVDDFGTGFSSLSYLLTFNIDIIKIDGSFIQNIPTNKTSTIITHSVINLARELNIKLVAEGIESPEQLSYLKRFNCHAGQGYLYSKPIPKHQLAEVMANRKCEPNISVKALGV